MPFRAIDRPPAALVAEIVGVLAGDVDARFSPAATSCAHSPRNTSDSALPPYPAMFSRAETL